jgi:drug/metabolite transporter (DMT)-like permease
MWNILHPPLEAFLHGYSPIQWGCIAFIGIFGTIFPFGFYFKGIERIKPTNASITATLEPISAGIIAALFLDEVMVPLQIMGGLIVIGSIVLLQFNTADK